MRFAFPLGNIELCSQQHTCQTTSLLALDHTKEQHQYNVFPVGGPQEPSLYYMYHSQVGERKMFPTDDTLKDVCVI